MKRHINECDACPERASQQRTMADFAQGVTYSHARFRVQLALWVARHHRPFVIVEDPELRALFRMLYSRVEIPSRVTVARDVHLILRDAKERLIDHLKVRSKMAPLRAILTPTNVQRTSKIHICVDGWTTPNMYAVLGVTAHWVLSNVHQHVVLDFIR